MVNSSLLRDPAYLPNREEIETWRGVGTSRFDNWDDYVYHNPLGFSFEIINDVFLDSLINHIKTSFQNIIDTRKKEVNIIEIGAGSGRLSNFLRQRLNSYEGRAVNIIATDDLSWEEAAFNPYFHIKRHYPVEIMNYEDAMDLDPDIVIASWMPKDEDWTKEFRRRTTVKEYLLIGNKHDCGNDDTWSNKLLKKDSFEMKKANIEGQMCFRDHPGNYTHSFTTSFVRK